MGPGLAIKALAGRHFSVLTFGIAQLAMDIEPLIGLIRGSEVLHGSTHTYLAALGITAVVAVISQQFASPSCAAGIVSYLSTVCPGWSSLSPFLQFLSSPALFLEQFLISFLTALCIRHFTAWALVKHKRLARSNLH